MHNSRFLLLLVMLSIIEHGWSTEEPNVFFKSIANVHASQGRWLVTLVNDFTQIRKFMVQNLNNLGKLKRACFTISKQTEQMARDHNNSYSRLILSQCQTLKKLRDDYTDKTRQLTTKLDILTKKNDKNIKNKRSLLPLGGILSFMFGVGDQAEIDKIKIEVEKLRQQDLTYSHILEDNLSIINITRKEVSENRNSINDLYKVATQLESKIDNETINVLKILLPFRKFTIAYIKLDLCIKDVTSSIDATFDVIDEIEKKINALATGHLSLDVIHPIELSRIMTTIQDALPQTFALPKNPKTDIWYYFKNTKCSSFFQEERLVSVCSVPLIDKKDLFEIIKVIGVPLHFNKTHTIEYELDLEHFAISVDRTKFITISETERIKCSLPDINYCPLADPVYPVGRHQSCSLSLFINQTNKLPQVCGITLRRTQLPLAYHISKGQWVISLSSPETITKLCADGERNSVSLDPPISVITLREGCKGFSPQIQLPAYLEGQTHQENSIQLSLPRFHTTLNISDFLVWQTYHKQNQTVITRPSLLPSISNINLQDNIDKIQLLRNNVNHMADFTNSDISVILGSCLGVVIILVITGLIIILAVKVRHNKSVLRKRGHLEKGAEWLGLSGEAVGGLEAAYKPLTGEVGLTTGTTHATGNVVRLADSLDQRARTPDEE